MNRRELFHKGALAAAAAAGLPSLAQAATPVPHRSLTLEAVQMPAWRQEGDKRVPLAPGDTVGTDQEISTGAQAALALRLPEGSLVRLGEKTRLGLLRLEVQPSDGRIAVRSDLKLFEGFLRFTTSAVAKAVGERQIDVSLRTATVGIRGTDFWSMTDAAHDATCLFEGRVDLATRDQGALVLDKPTAFWARFFDQPVKPVGNATPDELARFLKSTEMEPGKGVAVVGGRWRVVAATLGTAMAARRLVARLRDEGYPAVVRSRFLAGQPAHEVRLNGFAARADAQAVLQKIAAIEGVNGRVALSA